MLFYNLIDYIRKLGDIVAIIIFITIAYIVYNSNIAYKDYIIGILVIFALFDFIFTIDAIKNHKLNNFIKPQFYLY